MHALFGGFYQPVLDIVIHRSLPCVPNVLIVEPQSFLSALASFDRRRPSKQDMSDSN